jgi:hypothetical protein
MILSNDHLQILSSILREVCQDGRVVPRSVVFERFENISNSGLGLHKFRKALSNCINNEQIKGYGIRAGRNGGIYLTDTEKITLTCCSGKFTGNISSETLMIVLKELKAKKNFPDCFRGES